MYTPSLPYRRLVKFANGIWDENRKAFYPFFATSASLLAKRGISYYIKSVSSSGANTGDKAVSTVGLLTSPEGTTGTVIVGNCVIPVTVAASNVSSGNSNCQEVDILCRPNTTQYVQGSSTTATVATVYAEIPVDGSGVPVVVQ